MAKVSIRQREDRGDWLVRWPEYRVVDGKRKRVQPSKTFPTKAAAEAFKRQADIQLAEMGRVDLEAMHVRHTTSPVEIAADFVLAGRTKSTQRFRQSVMNAFLGFMGHEAAVDELDRQALEEFFQDRPRDGRKAQTAYRYLKTVEQMWGWAYGKPDVYRGVPQPIRVSGEGDKVALPDTTPGRAPTWAECDRMIAQLTGIRRKRVRRPSSSATPVRGSPRSSTSLSETSTWHRTRSDSARRRRARRGTRRGGCRFTRPSARASRLGKTSHGPTAARCSFRPCAVDSGDGRFDSHRLPDCRVRVYKARRYGGNGEQSRLVRSLKAGGVDRLIILARWNAHSVTTPVRRLCARRGIPVEVW